MVRDFRLGPSRRIKRRQDFLRIQSSGQKFRSKHFLIAVCPRQDVESGSCESRIGVTITTKVHKRAVRRNRLRRRTREIFRIYRPRLRKPMDIVVIALSGSTELAFGEAKWELEKLLGKINCGHKRARQPTRHRN